MQAIKERSITLYQSNQKEELIHYCVVQVMSSVTLGNSRDMGAPGQGMPRRQLAAFVSDSLQSSSTTVSHLKSQALTQSFVP